MTVRGVVLFDFDGTLAECPGTWSRRVLDVLDAHFPGHGATLDEVQEGLRVGRLARWTLQAGL